MIIALDYDGTFTKYDSFPDVGYPTPECIEVLNKMIKRGHKIVLNTMRFGIKLNDAVRAIEDNGIKLYGVNNTPGQNGWTKSPKVYADIYIDDRSLGIPKLSNGVLDWNKIESLLIQSGF